MNFEEYKKLFPKIKPVKLDWENIDTEDFANYFCKCIKSYSENILPIIAKMGK